MPAPDWWGFKFSKIWESREFNWVEHGESFYIGKSDVNESYLNQEKILKVCKEAKVDAVHPGYGFLSENSSFSDLLKSNDIVFIGPPSKAISEMGDKIKSKEIAREAKVNIVPGFIGEINNLSQAIKISNSFEQLLSVLL